MNTGLSYLELKFRTVNQSINYNNRPYQDSGLIKRERNQKMKLIKYIVKALMYRVGMATQSRPYYNLGSHQADSPELLPSFPPR